MSRRNLLIGTAVLATIAAGGCQAPSRSAQPQPSTFTAPASPSRPAVVSSNSVSSSSVSSSSVSSSSVSSSAAPRSPATTAAGPSSSALRAPAPKNTEATDNPPPPDTPGTFTLTVSTGSGDIQAAVAPLSVDLHSDGTAEPIDPPHGTAAQWLTAAWIRQSTYPAAGARGTTYVYGHACHHHVCSFTRLRDAQVGNAITVTTPHSVLNYRICDTARSAKSGDLAVPSCGSADVNLVLVTCEYEQGDQSTHNLVVAATFVTSDSTG